MPTIAELTRWRATGWDELVVIWEGLTGNVDDDQRLRSAYRGETLSESEAGYVFQTWIIEALRLSGTEVEPPYSVKGRMQWPLEQVDGFACVSGRDFLIESKFQKISFEPIARLHMLVERRPIGTLGCIFAAFGATTPAQEAIELLRPIRVLLFNRSDIEFALVCRDFDAAIRTKLRFAVQYGWAAFDLGIGLEAGR